MESDEIILKLDITAYVCPMTFVRAKLAAEKLEPGEVLEIRLNAGEALRNVPRTLAEQGYGVEILGPEAGDDAGDDAGGGPHLIRVRRPPAG